MTKCQFEFQRQLGKGSEESLVRKTSNLRQLEATCIRVSCCNRAWMSMGHGRDESRSLGQEKAQRLLVCVPGSICPPKASAPLEAP